MPNEKYHGEEVDAGDIIATIILHNQYNIKNDGYRKKLDNEIYYAVRHISYKKERGIKLNNNEEKFLQDTKQLEILDAKHGNAFSKLYEQLCTSENKEERDKIAKKLNDTIIKQHLEVIELLEKLNNDIIKYNLLKDEGERDVMKRLRSETTERKRKRQPQPKKAKPTFRSGNSQGKDMIKNMNRMTGTTLKRFR